VVCWHLKIERLGGWRTSPQKIKVYDDMMSCEIPHEFVMLEQTIRLNRNMRLIRRMLAPQREQGAAPEVEISDGVST